MKTKVSELNPNHPVTAAVSDHWHKIVALMMMQQGVEEVEISLAEIREMIPDDPAKMKAVIIRDTGQSIIIRLVPMSEAEKLAREAGGLLV
jgi:hypothetical protein